jgi:3-deoxy-D-manno-octulosonic-acid transferase
MYFIYGLLLGLGFLILLPRFVIDGFRHGKYVAGFRERLGSLSPLPNGGPVIWVHCVSVGEAQAARPLVKGLRKLYPDYRIVVSTITLTGQNLAREIFNHDAVKVFYFPFDWRWTVRRALRAMNPHAVLMLETELWPGFLRECKLQNIPVALVNGRLSGQSFSRYRFIKSFMKRVLSALTIAIMQTEADAERLRKLGMDPERTRISGNMKFDAETVPETDRLTIEIRDRFKLADGGPVILAASTHAPEETIVVNSLLQILHNSNLKPRLLIAPRHPERFNEVAELLKPSGLRWARRSAVPDSGDSFAEVVLLDSIGELHSFYSLATLVFVGGSLAKRGGHNIIEPAALGIPVIVGPHTYNFHSIIDTFLKADAIVEFNPMSDSVAIIELADLVSNLLENPTRRSELATRAQDLVRRNQGATERTLESLAPILANPAEENTIQSPRRRPASSS